MYDTFQAFAFAVCMLPAAQGASIASLTGSGVADLSDGADGIACFTQNNAENAYQSKEEKSHENSRNFSGRGSDGAGCVGR